MDTIDVREQLRRLGLARGVQGIQSQRRQKKRGIEDLIPGQVVHTEQGPFFLYRETYQAGFQHGDQTLADLLVHAPARAAILARDQRLADVDFRRMAFIDTETTGLAGGSGTYAFLVGVGVFEEEAFTIHQFFMRDFDEEGAQLEALGELLDELEAVVSFNGKSFDMPLLETRFIMARRPPRLIGAPHLDLLPAARRFWKYRLESCALSSLEAEILGVRRTQDDVPGWLIPDMYLGYARSGDASEMPGIFYHNAQDILSLVTLTARMCGLIAVPLPEQVQMPGEDLYGLGRLLQDLDDMDKAEAAYIQAAETCRASNVRELAMRDLAYLLKRQERRSEALLWWQHLVETSGALYACLELAIHYEWHEESLDQAAAWTQRGIELVKAWPPGPKRRHALADLAHRLERIGRKTERGESAGDPSPES